jgi:CRP/FNR family transcriptional regulator
MQIDLDLLITWGGSIKQFSKKDIIFREDASANYYYQIITGKVSMYNIDDNGKEFVQGLFSDGESFGEPPLFIDENYPSTAIAVKDSVIIRIAKANFFQMLSNTPLLQMHFIKLLARRIYNKSTTAKGLIINNAETRLLSFLYSLKKMDDGSNKKILITQTRQEIANATGLRVETVIRALVRLAEQKKVEIINHKLYF